MKKFELSLYLGHAGRLACLALLPPIEQKSLICWLLDLALIVIVVSLVTDDGVRLCNLPSLVGIIGSLGIKFACWVVSFSHEPEVRFREHLHEVGWWMSCALLILSVLQVLKYRSGSLSRVRPSGPHPVGFKVIFQTNGSPMSVFYPASDDGSARVHWTEQRYWRVGGMQSGAQAAFTWLQRSSPLMFPTFLFTFWRSIRLRALNKPGLPRAFSNGEKELVPVVISHGFGLSRLFYSTLAQELASFGYLVLLPDHLDGTCMFTIKENKVPHLFKMSKPRLSQRLASGLVQERTKELADLFKQIKASGFARSLRWPSAKVDVSSLFIIGSQLGATAALEASSTKEIQAVVAMDPWLLPLTKAIEDESLAQVTKPAFVSLTEQAATQEGLPSYRKAIQYICNKALVGPREVVHLPRSEEGDMTDLGIVQPQGRSLSLLNLFKLDFRSQSSVSCNVWACLSFLERAGLSPAEDFSGINEKLEAAEKQGYVKYEYKI